MSESLLSAVRQKRKQQKPSEQATEAFLREHVDDLRELIAYWRVYPDRLIDFYCSLNPNNNFKLFFYQRLFLRCLMRHKNLYATFVRAWSKSFISVMGLMLKCILYPDAKVFSVAGGKEQSASILSSKLEEICTLIPAISNEIIWDTKGLRANTRQTKDSVRYTFRNGSILENIAASEKTRGARYHSGLMEECIGIDQDILNEVIVPTMNVNRIVKGVSDTTERINKSSTFITTAGYKNTFSYDKLIQILCQAVARPEDNMVIGGSWRVPVIEGLLDRDFVTQLKLDGTFNEASFEREYESKWTGDIEKAFFSNEVFDRNRILNLPEYKPNGRANSKSYYLMGVDVGRFGCTTEVCIFKVTPAVTGTPLKQLVNIYTFEAEHFGVQALKLKKLFLQYGCKIAVVDGNGLGAGLVDFLVTDQIDPDTGEMLFNWGVENDSDRKYKNFETPDTIHNALYIMKANAALNTEMYAYCQTQMQHGKIKFLIDDTVAKNKLMAQAQGKKMSPEQRAEYLKPFVQTNILKEQMANLVEETEGANIILKPNNRKIKYDKVSALIYGLYWCKLQEDKGRKRRSRDLSSMVLFSKH